MVVVLPAPLGPSRPTISPSATRGRCRRRRSCCRSACAAARQRRAGGGGGAGLTAAPPRAGRPWPRPGALMGPTAAWIRWRSSGLSRPRAWATSRARSCRHRLTRVRPAAVGQQHRGPPVLGILGPLEQTGPDELADQRAHGVRREAERPRRLGHADPGRLDDGDQDLHLGRRPAPAGPGGAGRRGGTLGGPRSSLRSGRRPGHRARRPGRRPATCITSVTEPMVPLLQRCRVRDPRWIRRPPPRSAARGGQVRSAPLRRGRQVGPASVRPASRWRMPLRTSTRTGIRPSPSGAPSASATPSTMSW